MGSFTGIILKNGASKPNIPEDKKEEFLDRAVRLLNAGGQAFSDLQKKEEQQPRTLKPTDYSDVGQAEVLANTYGKILRYTEATDYIVYKGNYWAESSKQQELLKRYDGACEYRAFVVRRRETVT